MEKKRKLPARAAARVENAAKRRHSSTPRSETPAPSQPVVAEEPPQPQTPQPPPLPKSVQAGKPLPIVEEPQGSELSSKEYQSLGESGVLAESLSRSRQRWINDGLFEKYWTKPHKRKGVLIEDPKNPPKENMSKVGPVTITIEPHIIEATMYVVKDPKPRPQPQPKPTQQPQQAAQPPPPQNRPIIQYGPPNGTMPPPKQPITPSATDATGPKPATLSPAPSASPAPAPTSSNPVKTPLEPAKPATVPPPVVNNGAVAASPSYPPRPLPVPVGPGQPTFVPRVSSPANANVPRPPVNQTARPVVAAPGHSPAVTPRQPAPTQPTSIHPPGANKPPTPAPAAAKPAANDPVIALLAQKASGDVELRDLMKRVAVGQAKEGELAHFQKIIDQLNMEYKRSGGQQGPSADRLLVDGRTVKYFADEVRTILDIVLASNPSQTSTDLRPPPRSDPLVVLLVKEALDVSRTKDIIRRIAEGRPGYTDSTDLKDILDRLHKSMKAVPVPQNNPVAPQVKQPAQQQAPLNGVTPNGHVKTSATPSSAPGATHPNAQALRSKGPPPTPKPDISAVVFDFGTGDRHKFPKFSILEYLPTSSGQQVVSSFLIVRKGSTSEYGGDPELDYYQPITVRLYTNTGRHLENLARVVAPQDEVRRYMDDVMDNMTRAEYVLLAMRLPYAPKDGDKDVNGAVSNEETKTDGSTPQADTDHQPPTKAEKASVLWTSSTSVSRKGSGSQRPLKPRYKDDEDQKQYEKLINSVAAKGADTE